MDLSELPGDIHLVYLGVTIVLILGLGAAHNVMTPEMDTYEFGMCTTTWNCEGYETGDFCVGIEHKTASCINPQDAPEYRHAEAECALDAQGICNADPSLSGTEWAEDPRATHNGQSCSSWAEQNAEVDLLRCEDTSNDISQWQ